jgi:hypothetical protein
MIPFYPIIIINVYISYSTDILKNINTINISYLRLKISQITLDIIRETQIINLIYPKRYTRIKIYKYKILQYL